MLSSSRLRASWQKAKRAYKDYNDKNWDDIAALGRHLKMNGFDFCFSEHRPKTTKNGQKIAPSIRIEFEQADHRVNNMLDVIWDPSVKDRTKIVIKFEFRFRDHFGETDTYTNLADYLRGDPSADKLAAHMSIPISVADFAPDVPSTQAQTPKIEPSGAK